MPTLLGLTSSSRTRASSRVAFADERSPARCPALNLRPAFTRGLSNHGTRFAICFAICLGCQCRRATKGRRPAHASTMALTRDVGKSWTPAPITCAAMKLGTRRHDGLDLHLGGHAPASASTGP